MEANYRKGRFGLKREMRASIIREQTHYRRASLDTVATRTLALMSSRMEASYRLKPQTMLKGTFSFGSNPADMMDCIAYTDDTNPLYVRKGNPELEKSYTIGTGVLFSMLVTRHSQSLTVSFDYQRSVDPVAAVLHYDSHSGTYTERKRNVKGGNILNAGLTYGRNLAKGLRMRNDLSYIFDGRYGIMTIVDEAKGLVYNRQGQSLLTENLALMYDRNAWTMHSFHTFKWGRYSYTDPSQAGRNLFHYATELRLRYRLNRWKFTLSPQYILDHGYVSSAMNGSQVLLNAQIDFSFMRNRAELVLYAHDLLNKQKHIYSDITATAHSEGGERALHQYATLTFKYRLDPKSKGGR